jgi:hypothetical protein
MTKYTVGDRFDRMVDEWPDHDALVSCHQRLRYSYRELQTEVDKCARGFLALGMQTHSRIGLWSSASAEHVIATLAGVKIGAQLIFLDPACGATQLHAALAEYGISLLIVTPSVPGVDTVAMVGTICPELSTSPRGQIHSQTLPMLRVVVAIGVKRSSGAYNWGDLLALGDQVRPVALSTRQAQLDAADLIAVVSSGDAGEGLQGDSVSSEPVRHQGRVCDEPVRGFPCPDSDGQFGLESVRMVVGQIRVDPGIVKRSESRDEHRLTALGCKSKGSMSLFELCCGQGVKSVRKRWHLRQAYVVKFIDSVIEPVEWEQRALSQELPGDCAPAAYQLRIGEHFAGVETQSGERSGLP